MILLLALGCLHKVPPTESLEPQRLVIAHTNDHLEPRQRVSASAGLVMVNSFGAALGPILCALGISAFGAEFFMLLLFFNHAAVTTF